MNAGLPIVVVLAFGVVAGCTRQDPHTTQTEPNLPVQVQTITNGTPADQVLRRLGEPYHKSHDKDGVFWHYRWSSYPDGRIDTGSSFWQVKFASNRVVAVTGHVMSGN